MFVNQQAWNCDKPNIFLMMALTYAFGMVVNSFIEIETLVLSDMVHVISRTFVPVKKWGVEALHILFVCEKRKCFKYDYTLLLMDRS